MRESSVTFSFSVRLVRRGSEIARGTRLAVEPLWASHEPMCQQAQVPEEAEATCRGRLLPSPYAPLAFATVHPSSILRAPRARARKLETARFVKDLRSIVRSLEARSA